MLFRLLGWIATSDVRNQTEKRNEFLSLFNDLRAEALDADPAYMGAAELVVRAQLQYPDSAAMRELFIRRCVDGVVRAAGLASFAGAGNSDVTAGFLVEFD